MVADVVFALDSVPAVLSFTREIWIVLAANALALLGLRPLHFLISSLIERLRYLEHGLAVILGSPASGSSVTLLALVVLALAVVASLAPTR